MLSDIPTSNVKNQVTICMACLRNNLFPFLGSNYEGRVSKVIVFMIGGITYEEAYSVYQVQK